MGSIQIGQLSPGFHSNAPRIILTNFRRWKRTQPIIFFVPLAQLNNSFSMKEHKQVHVQRAGGIDVVRNLRGILFRMRHPDEAVKL